MIDHVCLIVNNLEESQKYYERILNMESRKSNTDSKTILLENKEVHFFIIERDFPREYIEMQHISIQTESIEIKKQELVEKGITELTMGEFRQFRYHNYKWIEWRDPDGIRLEYVESI